MKAAGWMLALWFAAAAQPLLAQNAVSSAEQASEEEIDPRSIEAKDEAGQPPTTDPCRDSWRCTDPLVLVDAAPVVDARILAPDAKGSPAQEVRVRRKLVLFQNGRLIQIKKFRSVRMARGFSPKPGSAPWQVQLQRPGKVLAATSRALEWDDRLACGGSLIAPGWIVTAAHCLTEYGANVKDAGYRIRLGVSDISNHREGVSYRIARIIPHPDYDPQSHYSDIALIRFEPDAQTARNKRVWAQTIPLDPKPAAVQRPGGVTAFFYGWGVTERDSPSALLQIGTVALQPPQSCRNKDIALCARGVGRSWAAQCHGDSGGPLVIFERKVPTLIGIVSHNVGKTNCGENARPGVFTRIAPFKTWIEGYTGPLARPAARPRS